MDTGMDIALMKEHAAAGSLELYWFLETSKVPPRRCSGTLNVQTRRFRVSILQAHHGLSKEDLSSGLSHPMGNIRVIMEKVDRQCTRVMINTADEVPILSIFS